jgi:hypothetical protein
VSDTPRTDRLLTAILDAHGFVHKHNCPPQWVSFARELERELNAANERIERLEVAGDELELATAAGTNDALRAAKSNWRKAKEAKP